ncbi:DUF7847 domain-containing protein [Arthrobacter sp. SLBN-112]|uniref:DUF7847 domain-containing protein n=1 Tax=Arthrobacter sp. SLBN-112 TaxID=2768452 RepID=UPI001F162981|nr:hypothetical protein [Arthrobacter sp. SLBN-112]
MSPQESGPGEPMQEPAGAGQDDGGPAAPSGHPPVPSAWEQPWAPPAGRQPIPGQESPAAQQPPKWEQPGQQLNVDVPYPGNPYPGASPYGGQAAGGPHYGPAPSGGQSYKSQGYSGQPHRGSPYDGPRYDGSPYPGGSYGAWPSQQPRYTAPPKPGIIPLRPLMFGEILDGSFQAIRRNAKAMLGAGLLAQSLSAILAAVLTGFVATSSGSVEAWAETASNADIASVGIGLMATFVLLSILSVFMSVVLQGAMVVPVARSVLNRPTGFRRMLSLVRSRIGALVRLAAVLVAAAIATMVVFVVVIVLLFSNVRGAGALLVIPLMMGFVAVFLWVAIKLMVAPAAVVIEELGAFAGLRRSWELTRANWWRILGITLVVGILVAVITQVVLIPASLLPSVLSGVVSPHGGGGQDASLSVAIGIITAVVGALVGAVGYAFQTSVMALLYMDLRMRKDGLDIVLLRELETGADPGGIPGRNAQGGSTPYPGYGAAPGAWPYGR